MEDFRRILLIVVVTGLTLSLVLFLDLSASRQVSFLITRLFGSSTLTIENYITLPAKEQLGFGFPDLPVGRPIRFKIPSINVDAPVEYVGLTSEGVMDAPKERANTAWFNLGPRPGESGNAVIVGHYGWQNKEGSVFDNLHKLRKGDKLYVEDEEGVIITFVVRESRRYDSKTDTSVFGPDDGKPHLVLITCEGIWDENAQQYPKRLVVFADKEVE